MSPNLNPLNFLVWSILESKACWTSHDSEGQIAAGMGLDPLRILCASCNDFQGRLKQIIKNKGHIG